MNSLAIILLTLIALSIPLTSYTAVNHSIGHVYASSVAALIVRWISPLAPSNAKVLKLLEEAQREGSPGILYRALTLDSDKDRVPDAFEYVDGLSPSSPRSFGYSDLAYFVGRIVIDGWLGDWKVNSLCVEKLSFRAVGPKLAPIASIEATLWRDKLYVAIAFRKGFVYGNTSVERFYISMNFGSGRVLAPIISNRWGLAIEAAFSYPKVFKMFSGSATLEIRIIRGSLEERIYAQLNPLKIPRLGPLCWRGFVEPLWARTRSIEVGLPVYYIVVYGDNRQPLWWRQIRYTNTTYRLFEEMRYLDPVAIVGTGDHVGAGLKKQIEEFLRATAFLANQWIVAGNHDWSYTRYADREFWYNYTVPNLYYRDLGRWRFILLNAYALDRGLLKEFRELLAQSCRLGKYVVLVWHVPITYNHYNYPTDLSYWQAHELREVVKEFRQCIKLMLFGHLHVFRAGRYLGIPYIITGGGGAPLSSPKYGLPIYHFVVLELYPNGTFHYKAISIDDSQIYVSRIYDSPGRILHVVVNRAESIAGKPVAIPFRVEDYVKGLHLEVFLLAKPGITKVVIESSRKYIEVRCNASSWFVYVWGLGVLKPRHGSVSIHVPTQCTTKFSALVRAGKIVLQGCRSCSVIATLRFVEGIHEYRISLAPQPLNNLELVDPTLIVNASGGKAYPLNSVDICACNGIEEICKELSLPLSPPKVVVKYFSQYVSKRLSFEVCSEGAQYIELEIDGIAIKSVTHPPKCLKVSMDVSRFGQGTHLLEIIAVSESGAFTVRELPFIASWSPPKIIVSRYIEVPTVESRLTIAIESVAPATLIVKCINTSVVKVLNTEGGLAKLVIKPIDLGIVSKGRYVLTVTAYDEVGHRTQKTVLLAVGIRVVSTKVTKVRTLRKSSSLSTTKSMVTRSTRVKSVSSSITKGVSRLRSATSRMTAKSAAILKIPTIAAIVIAIGVAVGVTVVVALRRRR